MGAFKWSSSNHPSPPQMGREKRFLRAHKGRALLLFADAELAFLPSGPHFFFLLKGCQRLRLKSKYQTPRADLVLVFL